MNKPSRYSRENNTGFLERIGAGYYRRLAGEVEAEDETGTRARPEEDVSGDEALHFLAEIITDYAAIIAFCIGAACSVPAVVLEWNYAERLSTYHYLALQAGIGLIFLLIELALLFWLGLKTVHSVACLTRHHRLEDSGLMPWDDTVANLLARAALELPDPVVKYFGIDPMKYVSKPKLLMIGLLYKLKVFLSSFVIRVILTRLAGRFGLRASFSWVAIPVTAVWDAVVMYRVVREARLRLFGYRLAEYLVEEVISPDVSSRLSPEAQEGAVRAIATMMVLTQNHHPNMLILLHRFSERFAVRESADFDNWEILLQVLKEVAPDERLFLLDLLGIAAAFDGHLSPLEKRRLPEAFGDDSALYLERIKALIDCLSNGRLHHAKTLCRLQFRALAPAGS
jgi:hypothetical protein